MLGKEYVIEVMMLIKITGLEVSNLSKSSLF